MSNRQVEGSLHHLKPRRKLLVGTFEGFSSSWWLFSKHCQVLSLPGSDSVCRRTLCVEKVQKNCSTNQGECSQVVGSKVTPQTNRKCGHGYFLLLLRGHYLNKLGLDENYERTGAFFLFFRINLITWKNTRAGALTSWRDTPSLLRRGQTSS